MDPKSAAENLQVIRTLMERSALYRRALAPVMLSAGVAGLAGALIGSQLHLNSFRAFVGFWFTIAVLVIGTSLLIARRQALRSQEPFWTPPTRQVVRAMTPPLTAGFLSAFSPTVGGFHVVDPMILVIIWVMLYGCSLHSAGLFVSTGVRALGWTFILASLTLVYLAITEQVRIQTQNLPSSGSQGLLTSLLQPHAMMGLTFGGLHLLASLYLYVTEKRKNAP